MMTGLGALVFNAMLVAVLFLSYAAGIPGVWASTFLMLSTTLAMGAMGWSDPGLLAIQALSAFAVIAFATRTAARHHAWLARMERDRAQGKEKQSEIERRVHQLRDRIVTGADEVDRGLKQYELVKRLSEAMSWEEMVPSLDRSLKHFFRAESWSLHLTNEQGHLTLMQRRGAVPEPRPDDAQQHEAFLTTFVPSTGVSSGVNAWALGLPLWRLHEYIGLLFIRLPGLEEDRKAALLAEANAFSVQLIFAMAKAKLFRELQERSRTDGLTGLTRRGPFEERMREEIARAKSFRTTFSVLMIDIDHFKRMNDTYGHQVGDEVLRTVAQRLKEGLYETDVIARYGGEEFVCLLPRSIPAGLRQKAEQIRKRVENHAFVIGLESVTVTISIGIAHFPRDGDSAQAIMAAADRALYAAKDSGRNQVVEASSVPG
jgi:diguanylate cyclase (GGDEF)-like protein